MITHLTEDETDPYHMTIRVEHLCRASKQTVTSYHRFNLYDVLATQRIVAGPTVMLTIDQCHCFVDVPTAHLEPVWSRVMAVKRLEGTYA